MDKLERNHQSTATPFHCRCYLDGDRHVCGQPETDRYGWSPADGRWSLLSVPAEVLAVQS